MGITSAKAEAMPLSTSLMTLTRLGKAAVNLLMISSEKVLIDLVKSDKLSPLKPFESAL